MSPKKDAVSESAKAVQALRDEVEKEALDIVERRLPQKVMQIHKLINSVEDLKKIQPVQMEVALPSVDSLVEYNKQKENAQSSNSGATKTGTPGHGHNKRRRTEDEAVDAVRLVVKSNQKIEDLMSVLKIELMEGIEMVGQVKAWIQFNIPKIEDGNNFGVGVQEECVAELSRVEDVSFAALETMTKYYQVRARLVHKMTKHPLVTDYRQAVIECDETQYARLRYSIVDMRNNIAFIHDLLVKNFDKLKKPRADTSYSSAMY